MNIPNHPALVFQYCPKCGSSNFSFNGIKRFDCSTCGFSYYINAATAVAVIIELPDRHIILSQRKYNPAAGKYDLPGGFVDLNEQAEIAAIREVKEELGINIDINSLSFLASFPNIYEFNGIVYFTCDIAFVAKYTGNTFIPNDDVKDILVTFPENIPFDKISFDSIRNILHTYIAKNSK